MATEIESGFLGRILYGVTAPFYLAKLFQPYFSEGAAIVNISSSRDRMSQPQTESYTAAAGSSCRKSYGYCQYGTVSLL